MPSAIKTLEQERAAKAWDDVKEVGQNKEYKGLVKSAPAMIITNGLMQTLAFYEAKDKPHHRYLDKHISRWVNNSLKLGSPNLSERLRNGDSNLLRLATNETLAYLQWLRRFAESQIEGDGEGN
ncbi:type III-B CRISPR module-associated protein Cmr5 [Candidatus Chlorohelix sp.]|uniref:type III-B CRISPR module-associated protein Cmr5 n=1 Tax=Candidatus Chlorohelix sp. TaxID=3139201 RepID=UPI00304BC25F